MQTKLRSTAEVGLNTNNNCFVAAETGQDDEKKMRQERSEKNIQQKDQN